MTLEQILDGFGGVERSIVVVNRTDPDPIMNMLADTFGEGTVAVTDGHFAGGGRTAADVTDDRTGDVDFAANDAGDHTVGPGLGSQQLTVTSSNGSEGPRVDVDALRQSDAVDFDGEDPRDVENLALLVEGDAVVAGSTLRELSDAVLLVNSDLYISGSRGLPDITIPSVLRGLTDTKFTLRGYPESNRQKLLLITISRYIERVAWAAGDGTLRSSFQRLSRIDDEVGTRRVYDHITDAGVATHLYGVPDRLPKNLDAVVHGGEGQDFTNSWFVVFRPAGGPKPVTDAGNAPLHRGVEGGVGLLAVESEPRIWRGIWTDETDRMRAMNRYIERNL